MSCTKIAESSPQRSVTRWEFVCPGCNYRHSADDMSHKLSGTWERPTILPSVRTLDAVSCKVVCNVIVLEGRATFLADSRADLVGRTIDLPEIATAGKLTCKR